MRGRRPPPRAKPDAKPSFSTWLTPDTWEDVARVLRHVPAGLRLRDLPDCMAFAAELKARGARPAMLAMRAAGARIYLPLLFQVLRTTALIPWPGPARAAAASPLDRAAWDALYALPWRRPEAGAVGEPERSDGDRGRSGVEASLAPAGTGTDGATDGAGARQRPHGIRDRG